jgi:hypothetical protein
MKVKNLKKAEKFLIGKRIPKEQYGNIGKLVEDYLEDLGYDINRGAGCDLQISGGVEVKTRKLQASSAQTVGSMTPADIISTPYDQSPIKAKFQQQFRVHYDDDLGIIVSAKMYDWRADYYQDIIREGYEAARAIFASANYGNYVCGAGQKCYFEKTVEGSNSYDFRLRSQQMEDLEMTHDSTFEKCFYYE